MGILPLPKIKTREACPDIVQWNREVYLRSTASTKAQKRGETDGNATAIRKKAKAGRPPKTTDDDDTHGHLYLENLDGTLINTASLRKLSSKARSVWFTLATHHEAPPTWGKVSDVAGEYYYRRVLNEPGLEFLQYCDDGLWKLREWTQQSYSGWARNHGIRGSQMRQKTPQEGSERGGLDDTKLIHISPDKEDDDPNGDWGSEGHQTDHNTNNKENDFDNKNTLDEEAETFDGNSTPIPVRSTFPLPHVVYSVYSLGSRSPRISRREPFVSRALDILLMTNSHPQCPCAIGHGQSHKRRDQHTYDQQLHQRGATGGNCGETTP